jgi:hypothetical protein
MNVGKGKEIGWMDGWKANAQSGIASLKQYMCAS